jgi:hypothetical protein
MSMGSGKVGVRWGSSRFMSGVAKHVFGLTMPFFLFLPTPVLIHTGRGGGDGGRSTSEKVRGALVHKRGRKYQHD